MSIWADIEGNLKTIGSSAYSTDQRERDQAKNKIRRAVLDLESKAAERESLRQMLVDQGIENARLSIEIEAERVLREAVENERDQVVWAMTQPSPTTPSHQPIEETKA